MKSWPFKDPDEVLDYDMDWTMRLYSADELAQVIAQQDAGQEVTILPADTIEEILSFEITPSDDSLVQAVGMPDPHADDTKTKVWLQGGVEGTTYVVTIEIKTVGLRVMDQSVKLKIKSK